MHRRPRRSRPKHPNQLFVISRKDDKPKSLGWANVILIPGVVGAVIFLVSWFFVLTLSVKTGLGLEAYFAPIDYIQINPVWALMFLMFCGAALAWSAVLTLHETAARVMAVWIARMRSKPTAPFLFLELLLILPLFFAWMTASIIATDLKQRRCK